MNGLAELRGQFDIEVGPATHDIEAVLRAAKADDPLILDFDETLWLRNSTEMYLAAARPSLLAAILLSLLDFLRPWKLLDWRDGRRLYRDWFRVLLITVFLPWTLYAWKKKAPQLGRRYANRTLIDFARSGQASEVWVISNGFRSVIAPLLGGIAGIRARLVAAPMVTGWNWRKRGKAAIAAEHLDDAALDRSIFVTDHMDDRDLLDRVGQGICLKWPTAEFRAAFDKMHLPFDYLNNCKREGQSSFLRDVMGEDFIVILLAFALMNDSFLGAAMAVLFLHFSFWSTYEIGYFDNDRVAEELEAEPKLPRRYHEFTEKFSIRAAWLWSAAFGAVGVASAVLLGAETHFGDGANPASLALAVGVWVLWMVGLVAAHFTFRLYNRVDKMTRTLLYVPLQIFKYALIGLILPTLVAGVLLILGQIVRAWVPYLVYRFAKTGPKLPVPGRVIRLIIFVTGCGLIALAPGGITEAFLIQSAVIFAFCAFRAATQLRDFVAGSYWIADDVAKGGARKE